MSFKISISHNNKIINCTDLPDIWVDDLFNEPLEVEFFTSTSSESSISSLKYHFISSYAISGVTIVPPVLNTSPAKILISGVGVSCKLIFNPVKTTIAGFGLVNVINVIPSNSSSSSSGGAAISYLPRSNFKISIKNIIVAD